MIGDEANPYFVFKDIGGLFIGILDGGNILVRALSMGFMRNGGLYISLVN